MVIKKLPDFVINRLKAWEIIERPSSILKELVENALDANANKIEINLNEWGKSYLSIQDDWTWIELSDMDLLLERYATSKIQNDEDIYKISSYWFRWEALASIAEVSKITVITKTKYAQIWTKLQKKWWDSAIKHIPVWFDHWTFVSVEDLFFNVPARQKFLKSSQTEYFYCYSYFTNITLLHCDKEFILKKNNNLIFHLKPGTLLERISNIYKQNRNKNLKEFNKSEDNITIKGVISDPSLRFWSAENIKIFVNERPIQDKIIKKAILDAYSRQITPWEYPFCIISLTLDPKDVDVNVHPSKLQVKFTDSKKIYDIINWTIIDTLWHNKITTQNSIKYAQYEEKENRWKDFIEEYSNRKKDTEVTTKQIELFDKAVATSEINTNEAHALFWLNSFTNENEWKNFFNQEIWEYKIIWQLRNSYIIIESNNALYYVDQHALAERIAYEWMKKNNNNESHPLLQPQKFSITNVANLNEKIIELNSLWFDINLLWENIIIIYAIPKIFVKYPIDFQILFNHILYQDKITFDYITDWIYATKACKTSIKAWDKLSLLQMEHLINEWFKEIPGLFVCQHWRPFFIKIEKKDIDKLFDR